MNSDSPVNSLIVTDPDKVKKLNTSSIKLKARALIIRDGKVLCQKKQTGKQLFMTLPGGTQIFNESLEQTLMRECTEEIGTTVIPNDLAFVIAHNKSFSGSKLQKLECVFTATVASGYVPHNGSQPDENQLAILWLPISQLNNYLFMPPMFVEALGQHLSGKNKLYWSQNSLDEAAIAKIINL